MDAPKQRYCYFLSTNSISCKYCMFDFPLENNGRKTRKKCCHHSLFVMNPLMFLSRTRSGFPPNTSNAVVLACDLVELALVWSLVNACLKYRYFLGNTSFFVIVDCLFKLTVSLMIIVTNHIFYKYDIIGYYLYFVNFKILFYLLGYVRFDASFCSNQV